MATLAGTGRSMARDDRFFVIMAMVMAATMVAGFSAQLATGRSTFAAPPFVHVHAVVFFGWVVLYVIQNMLAATGSIGLHRRLGWIGAGWVVAMLVLGTAVTYSAVGDALYRAATAGAPGAAVAPLEFGAPPPGLLITGR